MLSDQRIKKIIQQYYIKRKPDPFIEWYKSVRGSEKCCTPAHEIMLILVNSRFDQATKAEYAVENTKRLFEVNLFSNERISEEDVPEIIPSGEDSPETWREKYVVAHGAIYRASVNIAKRVKWDAGGLLKYLSSPGVKIPYLGPKTSRLAVRWLSELVDSLEIDMSTYKVPVDRNIYRVSSRLGIIDPTKDFYYPGYEGGRADDKIQLFAKKLFPDNPGLIDEPFWFEGRLPEDGGHCYSNKPAHDGCIFSEVCPRLNCDFDPCRVGMKKHTRDPILGSRQYT